MPHRPGHIGSAGDGTESMDRRKYLSTLAAGAAFASVAAGIAACSSPPRDEAKRAADSVGQQLIEPKKSITLRRWGYLNIFPPGILTIAEAQASMPGPGERMIRVPFYNSNGIEITEGMVVGFHLVRIGCPSIFAVAFNLAVDQHTIEDSEREWYTRRNTNMDIVLRKMGYVETDWQEPDGKQCDDPAKDWSQ